jgi:hypothetical protein
LRFLANIPHPSRIYSGTAVAVIVINVRFRDEPTSQVLRIMMLSRLMSDRDQSGTEGCAISAFLLAVQPERPQFRHQIAGQSSMIRSASLPNVGSTGLRSGESPYLRT